MKISFPFNHRVPKGIRENLEFRAEVHRRVVADSKYAEAIKEACAKDPLFFINTFGWTFDPRQEPFPKLPFILYEFQESAVKDIIEAINDHDMLIEKSRDMGASWICVVAIAWCWLFKPLQSFLLVSRNEDYVDKAGNPKALFWKIDFLLDNLPKWLLPDGYSKDQHRSKLHIENPENGSVIDGESTTGNVARGDRRTAIMLDEFAAVREGQSVLASTRDATKCRIFNSTPDPETGTNNSFYDMRQTSIKKVRLHWSEHPLKSIGLYTTDENGNLKVLDPDGYPENYLPILDGKLRSPWYDLECSRASNKREIATELDIDYQGSGSQYFDPLKVQEMIRRDARPPILVGDLDYIDSTAAPTVFREDQKGRLRLWITLDRDGKPPAGLKVVIGNDVSAGTGASNSCAEGWNKLTNSKLFEYVNPYIRPEQFARQVVALGKWFGNAELIWESGGPGRQFGDRIQELRYSNFYLRVDEESLSKKTTNIPGVAQTKQSKIAIVGGYRSAIENGICINYSKEALEECLEYVYGQDGGPIHSKSKNKTDISGANANHGDRCMADALAYKRISDVEVKAKPKEKGIPVGCLAWRNAERRRLLLKKSNNGW